MNNAKERAPKINRWLVPISLGVVMFLSLAHHTISLWEHPLWLMFVVFAIIVPIFILILVFVWGKTSSHIRQIGKNRLLLFLITSLCTGAFIAWRVYSIPASYHVIQITPIISGSEMIRLLEVQPNSAASTLKETALKAKWEEANGAFYATSHSQSFMLHFLSRANLPVNVLFESSPNSGSVRVSVDGGVVNTDLHADINGERLISSMTRYRGIPNGLFIPGLFLADIVTFGALILLLLVAQEIGQKQAEILATTDASNISLHRKNVLVLLLLGFILHLLNALATPLIVGPDSPSFLAGSIHLLKFGNLDGVSMIRGPGTTFLFAPIMLVFGQNPWGIKILLHLIALACIPLSYRIGWQLSRNQKMAFVAGLIAVLLPDLMFYSNYVMSDVPNIFCVLAFMTLLISALESNEPYWLFWTMLAGSFAALLRSENIAMLGIGLLFLFGSTIWHNLRTGTPIQNRLIQIGASFGIALLPILWWSAHNLNVYDFFGISNYQGEVFYDGWVYSGDANHLSFSDPNSKAIKTIHDAMNKYPGTITDKSGIPTGWEIYPSLLKVGYTPDEAFHLLASAAWDSIKHDPALAIKLLFIKYRSGLKPEITFNNTYPLPGERQSTDDLKTSFFHTERVNLPILILLQRQINTMLMEWYPRLYLFWILSCLFFVFISLFRSPWDTWDAIVVLTLSRIFIPLSIGVAFWRYTLAGWLPAQIIAVSGLWILSRGIRVVFGGRIRSSA
jgi:4-amino-4-deoxy-L-arabinose transferase-like glycosyltransferase